MTWWPVFLIDKCCQVTSLSVERTDHHVLLKALDTLSKTMPSTQRGGQFFIDKCCQVTSLSIERTDHHVLLKASCYLRCSLNPTETEGILRSLQATLNWSDLVSKLMNYETSLVMPDYKFRIAAYLQRGCRRTYTKLLIV